MPRELPGPETLYPHLFKVLSGEEWKSLQTILDELEGLWKREEVPSISIFLHRTFPGISHTVSALQNQEEKQQVERRALQPGTRHSLEWKLTQTGVAVQKVSSLPNKNLLARFLLWF